MDDNRGMAKPTSFRELFDDPKESRANRRFVVNDQDAKNIDEQLKSNRLLAIYF